MVKITTTLPFATGPSMVSTDCNGLAGGTTSTVIGRDADDPSAGEIFFVPSAAVAPGVAVATSFSKSFTAAVA